MADAPASKAPKSDKKPAASKGGGTTTETYVFLIIIICLILSQLYMMFGNLYKTNPLFLATVIITFSTFQAVSVFFSLLFVMGIIYINMRTAQMKRLHNLQEKISNTEVQRKESERLVENKKWKTVNEHVSSPNPSDWRLAVLEADILLGEMLNNMNFKGESIGEKLKTVDKTTFTTIDDAWEGHKIRNAIAHEGASFALSQREAKRVIGLYEKVFKEFYFI